jgi:hypothetical protein
MDESRVFLDIIPPWFFPAHISYEGWTVGSLVAAVQRCSLTSSTWLSSSIRRELGKYLWARLTQCFCSATLLTLNFSGTESTRRVVSLVYHHSSCIFNFRCIHILSIVPRWSTFKMSILDLSFCRYQDEAVTFQKVPWFAFWNKEHF